jgi:hypothetical protein
MPSGALALRGAASSRTPAELDAPSGDPSNVVDVVIDVPGTFSSVSSAVFTLVVITLSSISSPVLSCFDVPAQPASAATSTAGIASLRMDSKMFFIAVLHVGLHGFDRPRRARFRAICCRCPTATAA